MGISLLLFCQSLKVLGNFEPDNTGGRVGQVSFEILGIHSAEMPSS